MRALKSALVCCLVSCVFLGGVAIAQEYRGSIRGGVRDPDGGVIPGVTVTLINEATSASRTTVSNDVGEYVFSAVPPATYTVRAELAGFSPYNATGIELGVNRSIVIDVRLTVGGIEETITVTGETPLIETANASVASALDKAQIEVLPNPGRNVFILGITTPNVVHTGDPVFVRQQDQTNSSLLSLGGGPLRGNNYTLDGVAITDLRNRAVIIPVFEAVEEMTVQVNTYDAEMGRTGGGVFNTIHRTGTNNFAGSALYQTRPKWGRTREFFQEVQDLPKSDSPYHLYGGSIGGPIIKDKTFFWFSTEGYRATDLRNEVAFLPPPQAAQGDFSFLSEQLYNPFDVDANGNRKPFPNNQIPAGLFDPVGQQLVQYLTTLGCSGACSANANLFNEADQWSFNVNHSFSPAWQLSGTMMHYWSVEPSDAYYADLLGGKGPAEDPVWGTGTTELLRNVYVVAINSTHIPSDTSALTLRYGYTWFDDSYRTQDWTVDDARALGFQGAWLDQLVIEQFPYIGTQNWGSGGGGPTHGGWDVIQQEWWSQEVSGTYSHFIRSHTFKFGGQWRRIGADAFLPDGSIDFTFTEDFTQGPDPRNPDANSGSDLANMLLGIPDRGNTTIATFNRLYVDYFGGFIQDDWRLSDKLMLNLGLRIERETGLKEENNNFTVGFYRDEPFPVQVNAPAGLGNAPGFPLRGGLMYAGVDGNNSYQWDPEAIKLGPRVGFAYTIDPNTSIRGGFGIFWAPYAIPGTMSTTGNGTIGYTAKTFYVSSFDGITPVNRLSNPYPEGVNDPIGNELRQLTNAGDTVYFNDQFKESPYITKWSFDYQHEFEAAIAVKVGYVGSRGTNLPIGGTMNTVTNINQLDSQYLSLGSALDERLPNPFFGIDELGPLSESETLPRGQLLRPYPQFRDVFARHRSTGFSRYHALRLELEKRFRGNWGARVNYTYSVQKDNVYESNTRLQDEESTVFLTGLEDNDYGYSRVHSPHWLNMSALYRFPEPEGGSKWLLGGWSASLVTIMRSGFPLAIKQSSNNLGSSYGFDHQRPDPTGADPSVSINTEEAAAAGTPTINAGAFQNAPAFTPGTNPHTITDARSAKYVNWDVSFEKITDIGRTNLSLRFEFINLTNGVNWNGPRSIFGASTFGLETGNAGFPRLFQFMAKFNF